MPNAPADSAREQFQCVSGIANPALADQYLKAEGYDVERALDSYFSGPQAAGAEGAGLAGRPQAPDGWPPPAKPPENAPSASPYPQAYPPPMPHYGPPHAPPFSAPYPPIPPYGAPPASPFPPPVPHAPPYPAPYPPPLPPYGASPAPPYPAPYPPPTPPYKAPHAPPYSASHPYPPPAPPYGAQPPAGGMPPPAPYASPPWGAHPVNTLPPLAKDVLSAQFLMIKRPVEWANLLTLGMLENANKYKVFDPNGKYVARIVEVKCGPPFPCNLVTLKKI
ncbi:hypothetical protein DUNSADRAFT_13117 [Dunaliella salina]|uniref:Uncharacterized protein n=1 Tax=Dunaliella salina TaxID=3046 RepID=A0ABQ7GA50_DUNSA|nr:hypothetical protein DUNSADRAFT_13117 [Dunaliella salina]|eukprot:KAF5831443.1 hypothetical protein DUNSADRAFT_13117 [Dunaliella salina]